MAESDRLMGVMYSLAKERLTFRERVKFTWARIRSWGRRARGPRVVAESKPVNVKREMTREEIAALWDEVGG